jgi:phosphoribosylformimino-5-aminoimidazole carboxamide ribotide isomerase
MIELIPAIDIINGKCVRLEQGDYKSEKIYNENPLEVAKSFEDSGLKRIHIVDLDGARNGRITNYKVLELIARRTSLIIDFGGGIKSNQDIETAFDCGAQMVTGGSIAVKMPDLFREWLKRFGSECMILGADAKDEKIAVSGWQETTSKELIPFIGEFCSYGVKKVICTDISRDGMLSGPSTGLYIKIRRALPDVYLIASGGISSINDIEELEAADIPAVIFGKAIYEGKIILKELERWIVSSHYQ